jgi:hypothetical protein
MITKLLLLYFVLVQNKAKGESKAEASGNAFSKFFGRSSDIESGERMVSIYL